jgi:hypothetical protein
MVGDDPPAVPIPVKTGILRVISPAAADPVQIQAVRVQAPAGQAVQAAQVPASPGTLRGILAAAVGQAQVPAGQVVQAVPIPAAIPVKAGIRKGILRAAAAGQAMAAGPIRAAAAAIAPATGKQS